MGRDEEKHKDKDKSKDSNDLKLMGAEIMGLNARLNKFLDLLAEKKNNLRKKLMT